MIRKYASAVAALIFAVTTLAPVGAAEARDRGYHGHYRDHHYHGRHWRDRDDDDGDAVAAGVIGLVLGLAVGSLASQPRSAPQHGYSCYDNYQRCGPAPYYDDRRDYDRRSAYEDDYGYAPYDDRPQCTRRERQWDRYAGRYVTVDVPC